MWRSKRIAAFLICSILFLPVSVFALSFSGIKAADAKYSQVYLNELMPNPEGSDTDYEWIELYNGGGQTDLSGCFVGDKELSDGVIIETDGYLVITKDFLDKDSDGLSFEQRFGNGSSVWGDSENESYEVIELNISMKNSDDFVSLVCNDYQEVFDWEEAISGQSFSRKENGGWTSEYLVTPGRVNEPVPEIIYSHDILITEVYPTPDKDLGEYEWIELYNFGESDIDLLNWQIEDNTKTQTFKDSLIAKSGQYLILDDDYLEITLNNSGETLTLYDPNGEVVDVFEYESTPGSISNIRKWEGAYYTEEVYQTQKVTKGGQNKYIDVNDLFYGIDVLKISDARSRDFGEEVCVQGVVTVDMNLLGSKLFYIQDETGGIQVYVYEEEYWQDFKVGDEIKIFGELKETRGESRIYVNEQDAILKVSCDNKANIPSYKTGDIDEPTEGELVVITGEIVKTSGKSFYIDDGSGQVKILIKSSTGIDTPEKKKGQYAGVVGIVSQYGEDSEGNPSYRVLPRYSSDIVISDDPLTYGEVLAVTGQMTLYFQFLGFLICASLIICASLRLQRSKLVIFSKV